MVNGRAVGTDGPGAGLTLTHDVGRSVRVGWHGAELLRYVYTPTRNSGDLTREPRSGAMG